jgi:phytoene desaturase
VLLATWHVLDGKLLSWRKNSTLGGRIQYRYRDGFKFNLGPTMYLMPEVFEEFFKDFGIDINR